MRSASFAVLAAAVCACNTGDPPASGKGSPSAAVTISMGPNGKTQVNGAPLHGDAKTCAAFKACCAAPDLQLFCGLAQAANNGDCAKSLTEARAHAKERGVNTPACR
jgi:hypothetical protein